MTEYKLESHLRALCQESPQYEDLWATWILNKRACSDALKEIVLHYPHFSMHDASHAEAVAAKIEMILGKRIASLSPTDIWLLLHAAYAHDLGMVVLWEEITKLWDQSEFQKYLKSLVVSPDHELREASEFLCGKEHISDIPSWPLKAYRYVSLIIAAYFRGRHAQMSQSYIQVPVSSLGLDLGHSNRIQPRLIKLLAQICQLHTEDSNKILNLDYQTNGFRSDYAHPRFISVMLRLGDLLDVDNGRFNSAGEAAIGGLPKSSAVHKEKHEATTHLLVTPEKIEFRSDCPNQQVYQETRNFINQLELELDFFTKYWADIVPKGFDGYAPRLRKKELLLEGTPDVDGVADLRFEISQQKAFQVIEGSNIYKDKFIFIRELIQNALDATKLQLWQDLDSGTYQAWLSGKDLTKLQPYDINDEIYQNYPIEVTLSTTEEGITQVEVSDRGTGISIEAFKRMCQVCTSNSESEEIQHAIQTMPSWLTPTAGFGIGLQSVFLLADSFEISTNTGKEMFWAVVQSYRDGGYLQLQRANLTRPRGTTICVRFRMPAQFRYSLLGETQQYLEHYLDPITSQNYLGEVRIMEAIRVNCCRAMFPVKTSCTEEHINPLELIPYFPVRKGEIDQWKLYAGRYQIKIDNHCSQIQAWDLKSASYGIFRFVPFTNVGLHVQFKGNKIEKQLPRFYVNGLTAFLDVYGSETKKTITLDRSSLTSEGLNNVSKILWDMFHHCINFFLGQLKNSPELREEALNEEEHFSIYTLWLFCGPEQRKEIPLELLDSIKNRAIVMTRQDDGYKKEAVPVNTLFSNLNNSLFADIRGLDRYSGVDYVEYDRLLDILNRCEGLEECRIITDKNLFKAMENLSLASLQMPLPGEALWLYRVSEEKILVDADDKTKSVLLKGLSGRIPYLTYGYQDSDSNAKRYAIPALKEYADLAVWNPPYGLELPVCPSTCAYIIAPFVRVDAEKRTEMSEEAFIDFVLSSDTFHKLVDFVVKNSESTAKQSRKQSVLDTYKRLIRDYYCSFKSEKDCHEPKRDS